MKPFLMGLAMAIFSWPGHGQNWQNWWSTPDQQAQALMKQGQFAQAQERFENKAWAGAASYRAGNYKKAARLFQESKTEQNLYNQGNALAHLHQYKQAIDAYDQALAINPNNEDAIFNRNLVKNLQKKEQEKQDKNQENQDQQNKAQSGKDQKDQDQQKNEQQAKDQKNQGKQDKEQPTQDQKNQKQQKNEQQAKDQKNQGKQDKEQPTQDQKNQEQQAKGQKNQDLPPKQGDVDKHQETQSQAEREKEQAKQQWLHMIPDDPGGLMREKFLRDHIKRMRGWYS